HSRKLQVHPLPAAQVSIAWKTLWSLSRPSSDLMEAPRKVCASIFHQLRNTNSGSCAITAGMCRVFIQADCLRYGLFMPVIACSAASPLSDAVYYFRVVRDSGLIRLTPSRK